MTEEYDLAKSKEKLGALVPILTDAHGNIIDGFHRQKVDPNWPKVKAGHITGPVQLDMARLASNVCRRTVPAEEKTRLLGNIAKLTGWTPQQIAEAMGMSVTWVRKYLPDKYKDAEMHERAQRATRRVAEQPIIQREPPPPAIQAEELTECKSCHVNTWYPYKLKDGTLCSRCFEDAWNKGEITEDDLLLEGEEPVTSKKKPKVDKPKTIKPKETWEYRKAQMSQPISKMDEAMLLRLQENPKIRELGYKVTFQKHYCITEIVSDVTLEKDGDEIACFFDGDVHCKRQERDEINRQKAADRHHIRVLPLPYSTPSLQEQERLLQHILDVILGEAKFNAIDPEV